jgi:hypothetical protein
MDAYQRADQLRAAYRDWLDVDALEQAGHVSYPLAELVNRRLKEALVDYAMGADVLWTQMRLEMER